MLMGETIAKECVEFKRIQHVVKHSSNHLKS